MESYTGEIRIWKFTKDNKKVMRALRLKKPTTEEESRLFSFAKDVISRVTHVLERGPRSGEKLYLQLPAADAAQVQEPALPSFIIGLFVYLGHPRQGNIASPTGEEEASHFEQESPRALRIAVTPPPTCLAAA